MGANVHVLPSILFHQDLAIGRHEHGYGIGHQQHSGRESARGAVKSRESHPRVFHVNGIHQMMQGHMSVAPKQSRQQRRG